MIKIALTTTIATFLAFTSYSQTNTNKLESIGNVGIGTLNPISELQVNGTTTTNVVNLLDGTGSLGYLGRASAITSGWNQNPNLLTLTYQYRDFAIGGWGKTKNNWMGAALFINSDNGNIGVGTTSPVSALHVNGTTTTNLVSLLEGTTTLGYLGRGATITSGWNQSPEVLALTYQNKDFAIGGWSKSTNSWMGASLFINSDNGNVGIGTITPGAKLTVAGAIQSREVKVSTDAGADFVFHKNYNLRPLEEVAEYIKVKNHLPEIASAEEMKRNGLELGQMNIKLLQKIEELTLYVIDIKDQVELIKKENKRLKEEVTKLKGTQ